MRTGAELSVAIRIGATEKSITVRTGANSGLALGNGANNETTHF